MQAKKAVNYAESSDEEDGDVFAALKARRSRHRRSRATVVDDDDEDAYEDEADDHDEAEDGNSPHLLTGMRVCTDGVAAVDDLEDFVVSDDSDAPTRSKKRKRPASKSTAPRKKSNLSSSPGRGSPPPRPDDDDDDVMEDIPPSTSTAQKWKYDPDDVRPRDPAPRAKHAAHNASEPKPKPKPHTKEPEERYPWLAKILDGNKNPPGHPDFDPSTIYIPPSAERNFSAFERQYWDIKKNLWDTIVFFKKGKFYELYENDATIGHQLFDLKLTDRVNMRMVGVPESSLDMWINQFVAKGYKVARVDQMESALGKEMRERDSNAKADKIIRRELTGILTAGTLVDGSMLQDDMATYCASIKESVVDDKPAFGIAFVDAATGRFFISEFQDDVDLTKFETFVAQTSPRELLLEKSRLSTKALRILKNNTGPTTIWNYLKPGTEFWDADVARRELDCSGYFASRDGREEEAWPKKLAEARDKDLVMSALGGLTHYLRVLKLDRSLLSQGNFEWYNPIHRNGTLILDGQTLINLEIFANTANGGPEGTLFYLLNRCVTPFGKRLFRQWVCHPLCNIQKLNERLDAVEMLNADSSILQQFTSQMAKMPDLERLISRIHAGACKPDDFVRVLDGFEQIDYTMGLLRAFGGGNGLVDRLIAAMPNLKEPLAYWDTAFDKRKARDDKVLIPRRGVDEDFDNSQDDVERIKKELHDLLEKQKTALKCKTLKFTDVGKEIYQIEVPKSVKVPATWRQMSATSSVKRYYFRELENLVRELQEAEETHSQIVKEVASRFFQRFDADYEVWLQAIRIISQLDCLMSLAKASTALGVPSCRPVFVEDERSVVEFKELRHPCMINTVADFIPNDIKLGGDEAKINLLTGANAAGKSTILRMVRSQKDAYHCAAGSLCQLTCRSSPASPLSWLKLGATCRPRRPVSPRSTASCRAWGPTTTSSPRRAPSSSSSPRPKRYCPRRRRARSSSWTSWAAARRRTTAWPSRRRCCTTWRRTSAASASSRRTTTAWLPSSPSTPRYAPAACRSPSTTPAAASPSSTASRTASPRAPSACTAPPCAASPPASSRAPRTPPAAGSTPAACARASSAPGRDATSRSACSATWPACCAKGTLLRATAGRLASGESRCCCAPSRLFDG